MNGQAGCTIKLPVFEGPFDLLFHLVKKAEVDIWSVSIAEITEQYLAYLKSMQELNLEIASEFLVMAATLLRLKSKLLLPRPPRREAEEEDEEIFDINSPEELFNRLDEYRRFKDAALQLREKEEQQQKIFLRSTGAQKLLLLNRQQSFYTYWEGAYLLGEIMQRFAEAAAARSFRPEIKTIEDFNTAARMRYIRDLLERSGRAMPLRAFLKEKGVWELIATFFALLELARCTRIVLLQERLFGRIMVLPVEPDGGTVEEKEREHGN